MWVLPALVSDDLGGGVEALRPAQIDVCLSSANLASITGERLASRRC